MHGVVTSGSLNDYDKGNLDVKAAIINILIRNNASSYLFISDFIVILQDICWNVKG